MKIKKLFILLFLLISFKQVKSQADTVQFYPNPFNTTISMKLSLINSDTVNVTVSDLNGQIVQTFIHDSIISVGSRVILYQTPTLPAGVYFVITKIGSVSKANKIIKVGGTYNSIEIVTKNKPELKLYPNPSSTFLNINLVKQKESSNIIKLTNLTGQTVFYKNVGKNEGLNETINIADLAKGIYVLIVTDDVSTVYKKIIIE